VVLIRRVSAVLESFASALTVAAMGTIALAIPYEVVGRFLLKNPPSWTAEVACFAMVWASMFGGAVGLRRGYQVGMTFVLERIPGRLAKPLAALGSLASLVVVVVLLWFGVAHLATSAKVRSAATGVPMAVPYAAIPAGAAVMLWFTVELLVAQVLGRDRLPGGGEVA